MNSNLNLLDSSATVMAAVIIWTIVWLIVLATALTRDDLDPVTRLMWVVVLIFVPFFGVFLYAFVAPSRPDVMKRDTSRPLSGTPWENNPGFVRKAPPRKVKAL